MQKMLIRRSSYCYSFTIFVGKRTICCIVAIIFFLVIISTMAVIIYQPKARVKIAMVSRSNQDSATDLYSERMWLLELGRLR